MPDRSTDSGVHEAMLLTVGALGYEKATVQEVCERSGISCDQFHRRFGGKEECFGQAYEAAADRLVQELLEAGRGAPRAGAAGSAPRWPSCCVSSPSSRCWRRPC